MQSNYILDITLEGCKWSILIYNEQQFLGQVIVLQSLSTLHSNNTSKSTPEMSAGWEARKRIRNNK